MTATAKRSGTRIIRVHYERGRSGVLFASSQDIDGLVVSAPTEAELDALVPEAITQLYAACHVRVIVTRVEEEPQDDITRWATLPADLAAQKLKELKSSAAA